MRKRIEELAGGKVGCATPIVEFSVSRIEVSVLAGKDFAGEFTVKSTNHVPMRGMVYSSHMQMECLTEGFAGEEAVIRYQFHNADLMEGDVCEGDFFVVCEGGEYVLSFVVSILPPYLEAETGKIKTLFDFAKLAQEHWQEAKKLFYAPAFCDVLREENKKTDLLYEGIIKGADANRNLEEFLLTCRLKEQVFVTLSQECFSFSDVTETMRTDLKIEKSTWGYVELEIKSDADFLTPEKTRLTADDFLGSEADFGFYIDPQRMHAGRNFGRLTLRNTYQEIEVTVCAIRKGADERKKKARKKIRGLHISLLKTYVDYRLKRIVTGRWTLLTCEILEELMSLSPEQAWYRLLKAQALWTNGQRQEAEWILDEFKRKCRDRKCPQWGYYMYICTLMEHEELYISRLTEEIEQIYLEHQEETMLFFCLLFLRKEYEENPHRKLRAIRERIARGDHSPLLYAEVYALFCNEPYLMGNLGAFEIEILNWACKQGMLTKTLADQMVSVFSERMPYRGIVFSLLRQSYALMDSAKNLLYEKADEKTLTDDKRVLSVICAYLIRNQKHGAEFFEWYALGVENRLRITGLYEAYLLSMDARSVLEVPKIIQMYFKYNNQLGSRLKAMLYVNMIANKKQQPEVYEQNYTSMVRFAYEQMELSHIDDNLAVIYKEALSYGIYSVQISDALADVLFMHRITCFCKEAVRVIVLQKQLKEPIFAPIVERVAYVPLYSNEYQIFLEDGKGNRYSVGMDYQLEKLMHPGRYLKASMLHSPQKLPYLLYYFADRKASEVFGEEDMFRFLAVRKSEEVDASYKAYLFPKLFRLMGERGMAKEMEWELARADLSRMPREDRSVVLELCIEERLYAQAYEIAKQYGFLDVPATKRVLLMSSQIQRTDFKEDAALTMLCAETFFLGKYNDAMLCYLCRYYKGSLARMRKIYESADAFGIDTLELAGRILAQMLYTEQFCPQGEDGGLDAVDKIYESYAERGDKRLREAYLSYFAYHGFAQESLSDSFYRALQNWQADGNPMNEICAFAMLSHYAKREELSPQEEKLAEELLQGCLERGIYFSFYRQLGAGLSHRYQLDDKYFIEHRTGRHGRVWIRYTKGAASFSEEMTEVYEGIFVKKMILFAGEEVRYQILEEAEGELEAVRSGVLVCDFIGDGEGKSRYERLNEMRSLKQEKDSERLSLKMREYERLDNLVNVMFTTL